MQTILLQPGDISGIFGNEHPAIPGTDAAAIPGFAALKGILTIDLGNCIPLVSFSHGMKQQVTTDVSNPARASGRPVITDLTCAKRTDVASVKLFDYCLRAVPLGTGKNQPTVLYVIDHTDSFITAVTRYELRDALLSSIQVQSDAVDGTLEQFTLNFTEFIWTRYLGDGKGGFLGMRLAGWSLLKNRPIGSFTD